MSSVLYGVSNDYPTDLYAVWNPNDNTEKYEIIKTLSEKRKNMGTLSLREIIWEITNTCNKNCEYCGSKDYINNKQIATLSNPIDVANEIAKYPPEEITLSGGEPGTFNEELLKEVTEILKKAKITTKCVTNGLIFEKGFQKYFDWVGLSINTEEDIKNYSEKFNKIEEKLTIITNFGTHNIWLFEKIKNLTFKNLGGYIPWQIQLTEGKYQLPAEGIKHLREKIKKSSLKHIVEADNLQKCRNCHAGINSCGITYTGDVIPCLSMRSWTKDFNVQGNILTESLEKIWTEKFKDYRFKTMPCCRDCIDYGEKEEESEDEIRILYGTSIWQEPTETNPIYVPKNPKPPTAVLYGVTREGSGTYIYGVTVYGAFNPPQVMAYACYTPTSKTATNLPLNSQIYTADNITLNGEKI